MMLAAIFLYRSISARWYDQYNIGGYNILFTLVAFSSTYSRLGQPRINFIMFNKINFIFSFPPWCAIKTTTKMRFMNSSQVL